MELTLPISGREAICDECGQWYWYEYVYEDSNGSYRRVSAEPCRHVVPVEDWADDAGIS